MKGQFFFFVQNIYSKALSKIWDRLSALPNNETIKREDIEFIVNDISKLFSVTAEISFGKKKKKKKKEFQMTERQKIKNIGLMPNVVEQ